MHSPIRYKLFSSLTHGIPKGSRFGILFALFIGLQITAGAQIKKGQKLMEQGAYSEAIKPLRKDFLGKDQDINAGILLAKCYYQLRDYQEAADVLSQISTSQLENSDDRRFVADVSIVNEDYSSAYLELIQLLSEDQSDPKTYLWLDKVSDLIAWDSLPNYSKTESLKGVNSIYNDYAPYIAGNGELWFVSDVAGIQTVFPAVYSNQNLHLYYKAKLKTQSLNAISRPSMLFKKRDYFYHDGPIAEWKAQDKYVLTLRDIDAPNANIGLYFSTLSGAEDDIIPFVYNEEYNTGHATFSKEGGRMIFSSDRPGGYGQMDLWYCDWINNEWSEPVNMGPIINTPFNEVFPTYSNGRLYFSSDRLDIGYGALDVYYSNESRNYQDLINLRAPINGPYDDFSLTFLNNNDGYYSSNRRSGFGGDDIYSFYYKPEKIDLIESNFEFVSARIPIGTYVEIYNNADSLVNRLQVSEHNAVRIPNLEPGENYTMELVDVDIPKETKLVKVSQSGKVAETYDQIGNKRFPFQVHIIDEKDDLASNNTFLETITGKIIADEGVEVNGIPIALKNKEGVVLVKSKTRENGDFTIESVKTGEDYVIETEGIDAYHEIDIYGKSGAITQSLVPRGANRFAYTRAAAPALWMETTTVNVPNVFAVVPNNEPAPGDDVVMYDDQDHEILKPQIDEDGFMRLDTMKTGKAYRLNMPEKDLGREDRLVILDGNGDTSQTVRPFDAKNYFFEYLIYSDYGQAEEDAEMVANTAMSMMNKEEGESYKARIREYDLPGNTPFILRSLDGLRTDTLYSNSKGVIIMENLHESLEYELELVGTLFGENKVIEIFDNYDSRVYEGVSDERKIFRFNLLDTDDFGLAKEGNTDSSILKMAFSGRLVAKDASASKISVADADGQSLSSGYTASGGEFTIKSLTPKQRYVIESNSKDPNALLVVKIPESKDSLRVKRSPDGKFYVNMNAETKEEITLIDSDKKQVQVQEGARFSLPAVYYEFNSYYLKLASRNSLDKLVKLLKDNPELRIEIQSHTDSRGPTNYNNLLSQKRADGVADYLEKSGINTDRLVSSGKGESELSNRCKDGVSCAEEEHAKNRRTEFVILAKNAK